MMAYQLLARLNNLLLVGRDEDGEWEWIGTYQQWNEVSKFEVNYE